MSPSERMAKLYPQALSSLFVAFYESQGYGGGIITRLHTGHILKYYSYRLHCNIFPIYMPKSPD
jgi:hypothetical protein